MRYGGNRMSAPDLPIRVAILSAGDPPQDMQQRFGTYAAMIQKALGPGFATSTFDVRAGHYPDMAVFGAAIITGSAASVYGDAPWIGALLEWLGGADPAIPMVGLCFGHQAMAAAYGGIVRKAEGNPAVGLRGYAVRARQKWMDERERVTIPVAHFDQIISLPPRVSVTLASDYCPYAGLAYRDRNAISFQPHPEFTRDFADALIARFEQQGLLGGAEGDAERRAMAQSDDIEPVRRWIRDFIRSG